LKRIKCQYYYDDTLKKHLYSIKMSSEDKLSVLNKRLRDVVDKFKELKDCGMDEELLIIYIHHRTGLSMEDAKLAMKSMDEFYQKLASDMFLKALKKS
jgi:hypothetical protein